MDKIVIVYSIMHTGTWFTCSMIEKTDLECIARSDAWLVEKYNKTIENIKCDKNCSKRFWTYKTELLRQEDWSLEDIDLLILQAHHDKISNLYQTIKRNKPEVPVIVPMRDPLLSLHSKNWRAEEYHENDITEEQRARRCEKWIQLYKNILTLPEDHIFLFPIDLKETKEEKIRRVKDMTEYIGISFSEEMSRAAADWNKVNDTENVIINVKEKTPAPRWENFKEKYKQRDIEHSKYFMGIEFNMLNKDIELQEMLYNIGYRDLLWWR